MPALRGQKSKRGRREKQKRKCMPETVQTKNATGMTWRTGAENRGWQVADWKTHFQGNISERAASLNLEYAQE